jgi:hypothetical protein
MSGSTAAAKSLYNGSYAVLQLQGSLATSGSRWATGRTSPGLKPCTSGSSIPTAMPPWHGRPLLDPPPKRIRFNFTPTPPGAADPGTGFLGTPARFFACPGEASSSCYPQRNRGPPAWQRGDYTFFSASRDQEAGGSSVGTPCKGCLRPSLHH